MDSTTRLLLNKPNPDPVTGDYVDISKLNENFDKIDASIGATICTSGTRPGSPWDGQLIRETDTRRMYVWNATQSAWDQILLPGPSKFISPADFEQNTTGQTWWNGYLAGDTQPRLSAFASGGFQWGSGSAPPDTNLYRGSSGNQLRTDDAFSANEFQINGTAVKAMTYCSEVALASNMSGIGTTIVDVTGVTLSITTLKANAVLKAYYTFDFQTAISSAGNGVGRVSIAGTSYSDSQAIFNGGNTTAGTRSTVSNFKRVTLGAAGNYQVKLQASAASNGAMNLLAAHTKLMVEVFE